MDLSGVADREIVQRAAALRRPIQRAASVGRTNGRTLVAFGVLSLLFFLLDPDVPGFFIGTLLVVTGSVEIRAARRLAREDPSAPGRLAKNELVLLFGILAYCAIQLVGSGEQAAELGLELDEMRGLGIDVAELTRSVSVLTYTLVAGVTLVYQGGLASYFWRRRAMIDAYQSESPEWARSLLAQI